MLSNVTFELRLTEGGDTIRVEVPYNKHTIIAYIPGYILDDLGLLNGLSREKRREQYIAVFNQHQKMIVEKIVEKFNKNEQATIHLIGNDFITLNA
ncbi:MAG TPA: hypothetical protein VNK03_00050 [Gammaproteobacteria bacterium]|nr:hypothetical protein [Gammaproteobacteria bacterium]